MQVQENQQPSTLVPRLPDTISIKLKVYHSVHTALIQLVYIDKSQDPEFFSPYIYPCLT